MATAINALGTLQAIFRRLRQNENLDESQTKILVGGSLTAEQECAALAGLGMRSALHPSETVAFNQLCRRHPKIAGYFETKTASGNSQFWQHTFQAIAEQRIIGGDNLHRIVDDIVLDDSHNRDAAALLMAICVRGMQVDDTRALTACMASSGKRYDYRQEGRLRGARLIRRYPTGALSEKTALILPALIASAREDVNVASPFLVARSLGHTGGTWDKLSTIPGFRFPEAGEETVDVLSKCGVAMVVTNSDVNPADRKLYQLRSATETIECVPLIVASIASKHLALPVHRLLLDVRIGEGAFLKTESEGLTVGKEIVEQLKASAIQAFFSITDSMQPSGSAIGNALEVTEAVAVMNGPNLIWDPRGIVEQRSLVIDFFAKLMNSEFPQKSMKDWARYAVGKFSEQKVLKSFTHLLRAHAVSETVVDGLITNPLATLGIDQAPVEVRSSGAGKLASIYQFKLGGIVNRDLGGGGNQFEGKFNPTSGVILRHRLGDAIDKEDILCSVFSKSPISAAVIGEIRACFELV